LNILGISTKTHDSGIALLSNGAPTFVYEEERFNREKHTLKFPREALDAAVKGQGFNLRDIDVITAPWNMSRLRRSFFRSVMSKLPQSLNLLRPSAHRTQSTSIVNQPGWIRVGLYNRFGYSNLPDIVQVPHHDAHAAAFFVSPFEEAAVLVMDGYGDDTATSANIGVGNRVDRLWHDDFFDSLGMVYSCVTEHLGFKVFQEGTVMALAAYGGPTYAPKFGELIHLKPEGRIAINRDYVSYDTHGLIKPFKSKFVETFGPARDPGEPLLDHHHDLAYALQHTVEEAILHMVRELSRRHPSRNLVLTGGVALNCVANARILRDSDYDAVWVPPIASDSGVILGSTLYHYHHTLGHERQLVMTHPFYGKGYSDSEITRALDTAGLGYKRMQGPELFSQTAQDLSQSKIVGWFQGRAEIGPRALGNRSILSDARSERMKDLINARVKHREPFRPFAPAVLVEHVSEFFELEQPDPFMTMAPKVRADKVDLIPAAVHVDGTGRLQTVDRTNNPRYYAVIEEYAKLTGIPVILNTSFNRQEPIVNRPEDAISCYLRTEMDVLVLRDFYVTDKNPEAVRRSRESFPEQR
jgi:carbamoyltransferase